MLKQISSELVHKICRVRSFQIFAYGVQENLTILYFHICLITRNTFFAIITSQIPYEIVYGVA